jgi:uncharacterized protein
MVNDRIIRIITIDGGGVGGVIASRVIQHLKDKYPQLLDKADILAGTSTGGLIALGLAKGMSPEQLTTLYQSLAPKIFSPDLKRSRISQWIKAKYYPSGLRDAVTEILGNCQLKELDKAVVVPVVALKRPRIDYDVHVPSGVFISTVYKLMGNQSRGKYNSGDWSCIDIAMATCAAPTYFPAYRVNNPDVGGEWLFWDGGLVANNPALAAVCEVYRFFEYDERPQFRILSFGTGYQRNLIPAGDWGKLNAASPVITALLDVSVGSTAYFLRHILWDYFVRVSPNLERGYDMDDPSIVDYLLKEADAYCNRGFKKVTRRDHTKQDLLDWLEEHWS